MTQDQINELAEIYRAALDEPHHGPCEICEKKEQAFRWKLATLAAPEGEEYKVIDSHAFRDADPRSTFQRLDLTLFSLQHTEIPQIGARVRVVRVAKGGTDG